MANLSTSLVCYYKKVISTKKLRPGLVYIILDCCPLKTLKISSSKTIYLPNTDNNKELSNITYFSVFCKKIYITKSPTAELEIEN